MSPHSLENEKRYSHFERQFGSSSKVKYSLDNMTDLIMLQTIYPVELKVMSLQKAMHEYL